MCEQGVDNTILRTPTGRLDAYSLYTATELQVRQACSGQEHPSMSEDVAVRRLIRLTDWTGAAIYVTHLSKKEAVRAVDEARGNGLRVYAETLPSLRRRPRCTSDPKVRLLHVPLAEAGGGRRVARQGLVDARISTIATDVILCGRDLKLGGHSIEDTAGGSPAIEERVGIAYTEAVARRGMSLQRFADVVSANAAKILGMYPRKRGPRGARRHGHRAARPLDLEASYPPGPPRCRPQHMGGLEDPRVAVGDDPPGESPRRGRQVLQRAGRSAHRHPETSSQLLQGPAC